MTETTGSPETMIAPVEPARPRRRIVLRGCDVPSSYDHMAQLAVQLSRAALLIPEDLQGKPDDIMAIMWQAKAVDLPLMVCIQHMFVLDGTIGALAELQLALMRRAGHDFKPVLGQWDENKATGVLTMADGFQARLTYTIAEAATALLTGRRTWQKYPKRMLWARLVTQTCTTYCPEVLMGLATDPAGTFEARFEEDAGQPGEPVVGPELQKLVPKVKEAAALEDPQKARDALQAIWNKNKTLLDCAAEETGTTLRTVMTMLADEVMARIEADAATGEAAGAGSKPKNGKRAKKAKKTGADQVVPGTVLERESAEPESPGSEPAEPEPADSAPADGESEGQDEGQEDGVDGVGDLMACGCSFDAVIATGAHRDGCTGWHA